ncbi:hypothetical protein TKK_0004340 [Trichogramma kaykai]|uniref:Abnormal spindle-like microcephaly-associated protein ASH domain-containing protein n=1 Tax=Trichogramma kaykai TaxID=54128 RepID=A0ABD2XKR1_9HYME
MDDNSKKLDRERAKLDEKEQQCLNRQQQQQQVVNVKMMPDLTDVTIISTPQPQASSTVHRRSLVQNNIHKKHPDGPPTKHRQLTFDQSNMTAVSDESSLGIIHNISSLIDDKGMTEETFQKGNPMRERELARMSLKKFDNALELISRAKNENANISTNSSQKSSIINSFAGNQNTAKSSIFCSNNNEQSNSNKLTFNPAEITARSSEVKEKSYETTDFNAISGIENISYNYELMGQFGEEEFLSGSKAEKQLMADELSWKKHEDSMSKNKNEHLEFSGFSGIVGENVQINGEIMPVDDFFKNKCGNFGELSLVSNSARPSLGFGVVQSPKRQLRPLVDQTQNSLSEVSIDPYKKECLSADITKDPSVMSYSAIAQFIQNYDGDSEGKSPRLLVDDVLEYNKLKKKKSQNKKLEQKTFTVDITDKYNAKTLLRNETLIDDCQLSANDCYQLQSTSQATDLQSTQLVEADENSTLTEIDSSSRKSSRNRLSTQFSSHKGSEVSVPRAEQSTNLSHRKLSHMKAIKNVENSTSIKNDSSLIHDTRPSNIHEPTYSSINSSKEDTLTNSKVQDNTYENKQFEVSKRSQELCTCLIGIPKEADIELHNGTDRWMVCVIKLNQFLGDLKNINLSVPKDNILIEPNARKSLKIGVIMFKEAKLSFADFSICCQDMVTKSELSIKHQICFVAEKPDIELSGILDNNFLDFGTITEDINNSLSITLENKNSVNVPVVISLYENSKKLFSIMENSNDSSITAQYQKESIIINLKPKHPFQLHINFEGTSLESLGETALQKSIYQVEAKLKVSICSIDDEEYPIYDINLKGGIGSCKLDFMDVKFPLILSPKILKIINLKNSGNMNVSAKVDIVQSKESQIESRDFYICPNTISLRNGEKLALQISYKPEKNKTDLERHANIRITVGNKITFYPIIGEKINDESQNGDSFHQLQRSNTPLGLRSFDSSSSPHSFIGFNKSQNSGRNSPGSTLSGNAVAGTPVPIRSTHTALVWGSVRTGKSDMKQFTIRNDSNSKIKLLVTIKADGQNFKFCKDRQTVATSMSLSLQGMESKTLSVLFTPSIARAAAGKIIFTHYSAIHGRREAQGLMKVVQLYGYGGYGKLIISEAVKDTSGEMWLSLGKLNSDDIHRAKIKLDNFGDLKCFAKVKLKRKAIHPSSSSSWQISPTEILLDSRETQWITLEYRPKRDDLVNIHQTGVIHVGTLVITHGDEPTRLRIRRLYKKLKDSEELSDKVDEHSDDFKDVIDQISKAFPGEVLFSDLRCIGDSVQNLGDLCKGISQSEIKLTIELQPDETISMLQDNMDDSQIFHSLCDDDESHLGGESFMPE